MKKTGFSLIECLVAFFVLITIIPTILLQFRAEHILFETQTQKTHQSSHEILNQEIYAKGYDFNSDSKEITSDFYEEMDEIASSDVKIQSASIGYEEGRVVESCPTALARARRIKRMPLEAPTAKLNTSGPFEFLVEKFPVVNFLEYPFGNPPDTKYLFTDNLAKPLDQWGKWNDGAFNEHNLPRKFYIKAMHSECYFTASQNTEVKFILPKSEILFIRTVNSLPDERYRFTIDEITSGINQIKLKIDKIHTFYKIQYAVTDGNQTSEKFSYDITQSFHAFSKDSKNAQINLTVWAIPVNVRFEDQAFSKTFPLSIKKQKLKTPTINVPPGGILYKGDSITVDKKESNEIGKLRVEYRTNGVENVKLRVNEENS